MDKEELEKKYLELQQKHAEVTKNLEEANGFKNGTESKFKELETKIATLETERDNAVTLYRNGLVNSIKAKNPTFDIKETDSTEYLAGVSRGLMASEGKGLDFTDADKNSAPDDIEKKKTRRLM